MWRGERADAPRERLSTSALAGAQVADRASLAPSRDTSGEWAWLLLLPTLAIAIPAIALLAVPLGRLAFPAPPFSYWAPELLVRKPTVQAGYALAVGFVIAYALAVVRVRGRRQLSPSWRRALILGTQVSLLAFLAFAWFKQRDVHTGDLTRLFFTLPTVVVAAVLAAFATAALGPGTRLAAPARLRSSVARASTSRTVSATCLAIAMLLTIVWLLPAVSTDGNFAFAPGDIQFLNRFFFDEATSVLNDRSPLVDMAAYGAVWPYVTALPLRAFGGSYLGFSLLMATLTGTALLALYGVLRRVTGHPLAALGLYLPLLATSLFTIILTPVPSVGNVRYYPADYFGMFPLRYAGPYLLAWLTVRWIDGARARRWSIVFLFMAAGLVVLNNLDFGVAALGGTIAAVACVTRPSDRGQLLRFGGGIAAGLFAAFVVASIFTLIRAGSLPQPDLLLVYGRTFASGGYGNLPLPGLGFHLVMTATFVAAVGVAAARTRARDPELALTGMLAWSGLFGLGASIYFYAYRSHQFSVIHLFSAWALALALLVVVVVRACRRQRRWATPAEIAVLLGFGLAICSIAQIPRPWEDIARLGTHAPTQPLRNPGEVAKIASVSSPGERVAILDAMGHRVAREADVVNVSPYTGLEQMATNEQMDHTLDLLEREGGTRVFVLTTAPVPESVLAGAVATLERRGYALARRWSNLVEFDAGGG